jgi:hypothetical protein
MTDVKKEGSGGHVQRFALLQFYLSKNDEIVT